MQSTGSLTYKCTRSLAPFTSLRSPLLALRCEIQKFENTTFSKTQRNHFLYFPHMQCEGKEGNLKDDHFRKTNKLNFKNKLQKIFMAPAWLILIITSLNISNWTNFRWSIIDLKSQFKCFRLEESLLNSFKWERAERFKVETLGPASLGS